MAEEEQPQDIQAIVNAAVAEAVAKSLAEMAKPKSRQEIRNEEVAKRRAQKAEEKQERIAAKKLEREAEKAEQKKAMEAWWNDVQEKGENGRKDQNQDLGKQGAKAVPEKATKPEIEKKLTIVEAVGPLHEPAPRNGFNPREFLYAAAQSSSVNHPWRVYNDGTTVKEGSPEVIGKYGVIGGTVYGQGDPVVVPDQELIGLAGDGPSFVYLQITRDDDSREIVSASVKIEALIPDDDYFNQHRPLAVVYGTSGKKPLQLQFEEIRVWELMLVENGEFSLHTFDTNNRTSYAPPA